MKVKSLKKKRIAVLEESAVSKEIKELERRIAECNYRMGGYFPHPHWAEELERCEKRLKKLKKLI